MRDLCKYEIFAKFLSFLLSSLGFNNLMEKKIKITTTKENPPFLSLGKVTSLSPNSLLHVEKINPKCLGSVKLHGEFPILAYATLSFS